MTTEKKAAKIKRMPNALKIGGGKYYLARRIVEVASKVKHLHFVEAYAGGLSVMMAKPYEGISEVANDLNGWLTTFWRVLQDEGKTARLVRMLEATPFSEEEFNDAMARMKGTTVELSEDVAAAATFFICCRQSLAGRIKDFAPVSRTRTRSGMNEQVSAWLNAIEGLPVVHPRIKRVLILTQHAPNVIRKNDGKQTLYYLDPPYHPEAVSPDLYGEFTMTAAHHDELLDTIRACKGKVMISGYDCPAYAKALKKWTRLVFKLPNNAAAGKEKRIMEEVLWCNFTV